MKKVLIILSLFICTSVCFADSETTIGGSTARSHLIQEEGTSLRPRSYLNFTGVMTCSDVGGKTVCDLGLSDLATELCTLGAINCVYDTLADCPTTDRCMVYEDSVWKMYVNNTLQSQWPDVAVFDKLLLEDGTFLLLEDGGYLLLE